MTARHSERSETERIIFLDVRNALVSSARFPVCIIGNVPSLCGPDSSSPPAPQNDGKGPGLSKKHSSEAGR